MKRLISCILICMLCLGAFCFAGAENDGNNEGKLQTNYASIKASYEKAVSLQEKNNEVGDAIEEYKKLINYYENKAEKGIENYAILYYLYAQARVELSKENPDYQYAYERLKKCDNSFYMVSAYLQYAAGMSAMQEGDYADAIQNLNAVSLDEFKVQRINAIDECSRLFKESTIANAKMACANGNHDAAQEYYNNYLSVIERDAEIKQLLNECKTKHGGGGGVNPVDPILEIVNAVTSAPNTLKISWKGNGEQYTVTWASDLIRGKDTKSETVEGKSLTIEGLLPGTVYRVTIDYQGISAQIERETRKAKDYPGADDFRMGNSMFRFNENRYDFLSSGMNGFEFLQDKDNYKALRDRTVELTENPISESCVFFMFSTNGLPDDLNGKPYQLLLHIDGVATLLDAGVFGDEKVCADGDYIGVVVYDLFDQAVEEYSDLSGKAFRLDLLVEDKLVDSAEGLLQ